MERKKDLSEDEKHEISHLPADVTVLLERGGHSPAIQKSFHLDHPL